MLHKGADHTTIAMHDQPARKPLSSSVNRVNKHMLKTRIEQFITYFNATMARPFRWTYAGKPLVG